MPDPALNPGELFFDTLQGLLDASVDTQLSEIERGLIDKLGADMTSTSPLSPLLQHAPKSN